MKKLMTATAALLASSAAFAQTPPPVAAVPPAPAAPMVHPMHDKVTTRAETVAMVREHFGRLDANKDGIITTAEIAEGRAEFATRFGGPEGGGPHVMRIERELRDPNAAFDRLDSNKDGSITREEFAKAREERIERRIVKREGKEGQALGHGEHIGSDVYIHRMDKAPKEGKEVRKHVMRMKGPHRFSSRMIVMADTDKDGKITLQEAETLALQHFDKLDVNKDGQVTPEERRAGRHMIIKKRIEEKKSAS